MNSALSDSAASVTNHTARIAAGDESLWEEEEEGEVEKEEEEGVTLQLYDNEAELKPVGKITAHTTTYVHTYKQTRKPQTLLADQVSYYRTYIRSTRVKMLWCNDTNHEIILSSGDGETF